MCLGPFEDFDINNKDHTNQDLYILYPGDTFEHTCKALDSLPPEVSSELLWGTLLHDVGKPPVKQWDDKKGRLVYNRHELKGARMAQDIMARFKFSNEFTNHVVALVENHMKFCVVPNMKKSTLQRFCTLHKFDEHLALHMADCLSSHGGLDTYNYVLQSKISFSNEEGKVVLPERLVKGSDLLYLGFKPGPIFKEILEAVETEFLDGVLKTKEQALEYINTNYANNK